MLPTQNGAMRLFRAGGITVFLHYSWFIVAVIEVQIRSKTYGSLAWNAAEYLALFAIVLMHEFGHSLACRQTGGQADKIILWPFGGIAFVNPPQRPGAVLWSIAAGPLVNVVLVGVFKLAFIACQSLDLVSTAPDAYLFLKIIATINLYLLIFNMLPIYPLDGGQILRAILWFVFGRARSLTIAAVIGAIGGAVLIVLAALTQNWWLLVLMLFVLSQCWAGFKHARALGVIAKIPRRDGFACPSCGAPPVLGPAWVCPNCKQEFDTFESGAFCPKCEAQFPGTTCFDCRESHPIAEWKTGARKN